MAPHEAALGTALQGAGWLLQPGDPNDVFTPERTTEDQRLIAQTVAGYVKADVVPALDRLEQKDWTVARDLVKRAADLGLLGVDVPESDDGVHVDTATSMIVSEGLAQPGSFAATIGAQVNLTILPLVMFGTPEQKQRYMPGLLSGELIGAYCLSEPSAGSDALGGRTRATRTTGGGFLISGEKMWITNGGFADVFIVFAKVDGEHFSAFIVERAFGGVTSGKEEHKLGLNGSSTTSVTFHETPVPAENLLGEIGKGHKVAFNVLNLARLKLGAMCVAGCRMAAGEAARYAAERKQFGQPIATFGAIRHKIGEMVARTYAADSMNYRTVGLIDRRIERSGGWTGAVLVASLEEFAIEASIAKVAGSEVLDFVLDENIQIHGGNGFVRDYPAERYYRDSRVNRIFEGTNEINRLLIPGLVARRAAVGGFDLEGAAAALRDTDSATLGAGVLSHEAAAVGRFKQVALLTVGAATRTFGKALAQEQEVLTHCADVLIDVYGADSAVLRAAAARGPKAQLHADAARVFVHDAALRIAASARQALSGTLQGGALDEQLGTLSSLLTPEPVNTTELRRHLADETVKRGAYPF